jgi:hypothetical protein
MELQQRVWEHYERADAGAPRMADKPGGENSGKKSTPISVLYHGDL